MIRFLILSLLLLSTAHAESLMTTQASGDYAARKPTAEERWFIDRILDAMDAVGPRPDDKSVEIVTDPRKPYPPYANWRAVVDAHLYGCPIGGENNWYYGCLAGLSTPHVIFIVHMTPSVIREINATIPPHDARFLKNPCSHTARRFGSLVIHENAHSEPLDYQHGAAMRAYERRVFDEFVKDAALVQTILYWDQQRLMSQGC